MAKVPIHGDDDATMDDANATPVVATSISPDTARKEQWERNKNEISSSIIGHYPLSSTMQLIADAFVALHPLKSIAVFLLTGDQFYIAAEAGLPKRASADKPDNSPPPRGRSRGLSAPVGNRAGGRLDRSCPAFGEILQSGVKLCVAMPLLSSSGEASGLVAVFDEQEGQLGDVTQAAIQSLCDLTRLAIEHRQLYDLVLHRSQYDPLTGLPNRLLLEDRLRQATVIAKRQGTLIAVCCIDLDRFKQINDNLGHELGDVCFKAISDRLKKLIRDLDTLARHGGDEFILALNNLAHPSDAQNICNRLLKELSVPVLAGGQSVTLTASAGISIFPYHGDTTDLLLRNADVALQEAKRAGRGHAQIYSPALGRQSRRAAEMMDALVDAVALGQFRIAYQPIYSTSGEVVAFEALLRWKHPKWGRVRPVEFIPIAEKTGLIVSIGDWVIDEVCRQAMEWNAAGVPAVKIYANVSGVQLGRSNFGSKIAQALGRSGLAPDRLEIEITESWIISDLKGAAGKLQKLRDLGIGIAIDDFGTGHSTFSYLQELPLDTLKIDRTFIHGLDGSAVNLSTVRAIKGLAQQLGLKTVAEGVESEQQINQLAEIGCEFVQGFFLAKPLTPQAACSLLREQRARLSFPEVASKGNFVGAPATR